MIKVEKIKNQMHLFDFNIIDNKNVLVIMFGGNGDLYFYVNKANLEGNEIVNFEITKENYILYNLFDKLYNDIINCNIFKFSERDVELSLEDEEETGFYLEGEIEDKKTTYSRWNEELKKRYQYNQLVNNGVISWRSDNNSYKDANILNIHKEDDQYRLEFIPRSREMSFFVDVRISNSGSYYAPFNIAFMRLYNELQNYDPEYHQVHLEECLYQKRLELRRK